ncbi:MAG: dolichyl-phosphate beta-glucosyltransferase [Claussenomyces sp. TS43310]|nr:MAG: dolichyl-phosphate beta-glucosyltransferase [Claussenomyces sp. TS43310]
MAGTLEMPINAVLQLRDSLQNTSLSILLLGFVILFLAALAFLYLALYILAPAPRQPYPSEKSYITTSALGKATPPLPLPSWHDTWAEQQRKGLAASGEIDPAEVVMSVVIPAYNEEERLEGMLEEAIAYLDAEYGRPSQPLPGNASGRKALNGGGPRHRGARNGRVSTQPSGYEILLVNDGSTDKTVDVALRIAQKRELHDVLRVVTLKDNRGKGGAVTHGFRHVRGQYAIFADADGASRFSDLGKLVKGCEDVNDGPGRGVAVGSRAHMVGSEAVIKRSALRNALMHGFHLLLRLLTPPATSRIKDTQCGFKLFSRASLPHIIPYMHAEGWIFDVEMLMLAESAPPPPDAAPPSNPRSSREPNAAQPNKVGPGIRVAEVPIGWQEVGGSKLNVMWDSLGMAWGLALLRLSWALGVYRRR